MARSSRRGQPGHTFHLRLVAVLHGLHLALLAALGPRTLLVLDLLLNLLRTQAMYVPQVECQFLQILKSVQLQPDNNLQAWTTSLPPQGRARHLGTANRQERKIPQTAGRPRNGNPEQALPVRCAGHSSAACGTAGRESREHRERTFKQGGKPIITSSTRRDH
jgi:hypothetical protein